MTRTRQAAALALALALAAIVLAGCGATPLARTAAPEPTVGAATGAWATISGTLQDRLDPAAAAGDACTRGTPACLTAVAGEMSRRLAVLSARCSHQAPFSLMYLRVTEGVGGPAVRFRSEPYLRHLDSLFARLYFSAFDNWTTGHQAKVPEAWRLAFAAADAKVTTGLGDMMLGMNAHISRDLPFALVQAGLTDETGRPARKDYDRVNRLLGSVQDAMLAEEARRFDPAIPKFGQPVLGISTKNVAQLLAIWRGEAFQNARHLLAAATPAARRRVARHIETIAAQRARVIELAMSDALVGGTSKLRDAYCRAHRVA